MNKIKVKSSRGHKWTLVDADDYQRLNKYSWWLRERREGHYYAFRSTRVDKKHRTYSMHREIMGVHESHYNSKNVHVDHINSKGLDNRRSNLRLCTPSQNLANMSKRKKKCQSKFKGVDRNNSKSNWRARVQCNGVRYNLGAFKTQEEAVKAYNKKAKKLFREFYRSAEFMNPHPETETNEKE